MMRSIRCSGSSVPWPKLECDRAGDVSQLCWGAVMGGLSLKLMLRVALDAADAAMVARRERGVSGMYCGCRAYVMRVLCF